MTVAELRAAMQSSDEVSRELPASERSMRIEAQKKRLQGLPLEGPLSVAHCVYDKLANMRENDELKYLSPGECITRDAELCSEKPPKAPQLDANKMGRSLDLTAAYRQLCVSVGSRKFAVIAVYSPHSGKTCLFTQICLPFGSRASVNGFIRCSRCIQWLATRCLLVPVHPLQVWAP